MIKILIRAFFILTIGFFLFHGCTTQKGVKKGLEPFKVAAGVDSALAAIADSMSSELFVSIKEEQEATELKEEGKNKVAEGDTLWKYLAMEKDSSDVNVSVEDSLTSIETYNRAALKIQEAYTERQKGQDEAITAKVFALLDEARIILEQAVVLNPFDLETKSWLAKVYEQLATRFLQQENYQKAIDILKKLVRLNKGEHVLYARLGENYSKIENWDLAFINFAKAEKVMLDLAFMTEPDTNRLFYYAYYQGVTQAKLDNADSSLYHFERALLFPVTEQNKQIVQSYIDWINWDDGNIPASENRDVLLEYVNNSEYKEAGKGFEKLIPSLKTQKAINEIQWRLSVIEFQNLEKEEQGLNRLAAVKRLIDVDETGYPLDSLDQRFFDSYGAMCHNMALKFTKKERRTALQYFLQAIDFPWESRAKSLLELSKLSINDPDKVLEYCLEAKVNADQLTYDEIQQVHQLLISAYKSKGLFNDARRIYNESEALKKKMQGEGS